MNSLKKNCRKNIENNPASINWLILLVSHEIFTCHGFQSKTDLHMEMLVKTVAT